MVRSRWRPAWWVWLGLGLSGLAIAIAGATVYAGAVEAYITSHSNYWSDFYHVPVPSDDESRQAILGTVLLVVGCAAAAGASLIGLRTTKRRWLALRAIAAGLFPLVLAEIGLRGWFQLVVNTMCGDCTPSPPNPPWPAFSAGANVVGVAILLGFALCVLLALMAILRRSPADARVVSFAGGRRPSSPHH